MASRNRASPTRLGAACGATAGLMFFAAVAAVELMVLLPLRYPWLDRAPFGWLANAAVAYSFLIYAAFGVVAGAVGGALLFLALSLRGRLVAIRWGWLVVTAAGCVVLVLLAGTLLNSELFPTRSHFGFYVWNGVFLAGSLIYAAVVGISIKRGACISGQWPRVRVGRLCRGTVCLFLGISAYFAISVALVAWRGPVDKGADGPATAGNGASTKPPNVLLVVIETARADHVGCYGYYRNTTPAIDMWMAEGGTLFENAIVQASFSGPSKASIATGRYPQSHGVRDHPMLLPYEEKTLAEILKEHGYATAGIGAGAWEDPEYGYHQGFDSFHSITASYDRGSFWPFLNTFNMRLNQLAPWYTDTDERAYLINAEHAADMAHEWMLAKVEEDKPFFMCLEFNEPHFTYVPPPPFDTSFGPTDKGKELVNEIQAAGSGKGRYRYEYESFGFDEETLEQMIALYDGEIAFCDHALGKLFDAMSSTGYLASTIVVVTSDHGENFGEHGVYFCHTFLYEPSVRVPLLVRYPTGIPSGVKVSHPVGLIDIVPTVLDLAEIETAGLRLDGQSLVEVTETGGGKPYVFIESRYYHPSFARYKNYRLTLPGLEGKWRAVRHGNLKLLRIPTPSGTIWEMYDLASDPMETVNLSGDHPMEEELREVLEAWITLGMTTGEPAAVKDQETMERLRSLGYVD
jgi:arylsulfatase A-like enzyme